MRAFMNPPGVSQAVRTALLAAVLGFAASNPLPAQASSDSAERGPRRQALERELRERIGREVQRRLQLDEEKMRQLGRTNERFEAQRRILVAQERAARIGLRQEMLRGDSASHERVAMLLDTLIGVQRKRVELVEQEQRALSAFLDPVQRAKYLVMQDQMRRRMDEMRRNARRPGARGRPGQPPRGP